jgi:predicted choloylglycine hydrolase
MPELVPVWEHLVELAGGDEVTARLLTLWNPPAFPPGCSQATLGGRAPLLIRNYDYGLDLFERVVYSTAFTGRRVLGTGDCLWGLVDGMNDAGLAVSLAFGGTNHRGTVPEYPERARSLRSVERQRLLLSLLDSEPDVIGLASAFLRPPLRSTEYGRAFGTLYTAVYRPNEGVVDYLWPDDSWQRTFDSVDATKTVVLREP